MPLTKEGNFFISPPVSQIVVEGTTYEVLTGAGTFTVMDGGDTLLNFINKDVFLFKAIKVGRYFFTRDLFDDGTGVPGYRFKITGMPQTYYVQCKDADTGIYQRRIPMIKEVTRIFFHDNALDDLGQTLLEKKALNSFNSRGEDFSYYL
jgi:hypothetical protein